MTQKEILEYNKRCAEFLGAECLSPKTKYSYFDFGEDWQIDHATPKYKFYIHGEGAKDKFGIELNDIKNLMPAVKIVNHYKRDNDIESFRRYMLSFHKRLAKLPKKTSVERTKKKDIIHE